MCHNESLFKQRTGNFLRVVDIYVKLAGMNSDHCSKEKKDARLMEKKKTAATYQVLGEEEILEKSNEELLPHFLEAREKMIKGLEGAQNGVHYLTVRSLIVRQQ